MRTLEHPGDTELLMAVDGELARRRQAIVDAHVSHCVPCRLRVGEIRSALAAASALGESDLEPPLPSPVGARVRLEHALREAANEWDRPWHARMRGMFAASPVRAGFAAAAALALLVVWMSGSYDVLRGMQPPRGRARNPLPVAALTPGAVSALTAAQLCAGVRPSRLVTADARQRVLRDYRMENVSERTYELDALITPELGGTTEPQNLWPQRYESAVWNAHVKDELERLLPELVCSNQLELAQAQRDIAKDWIAAYKRYFKTDAPLRAHLGPNVADDDDLEFAPAGYTVAMSRPMVVLSAAFGRR